MGSKKSEKYLLTMEVLEEHGGKVLRVFFTGGETTGIRFEPADPSHRVANLLRRLADEIAGSDRN